MKTKILTLSLALAVSALGFSALHADDHATVAKDSTIKNEDKTFLEKAAKSGDKEVGVSRAALPHLTHPDVKAFAEMMVSDHMTAGTELRSLAMTKGVTLPMTDSKQASKWSEKSSKKLDEEYIDEMVSDHKDAVDLFQKATKSDDADIAAFAKKTLPTLQHHLDKAKALEKAVD